MVHDQGDCMGKSWGMAVCMIFGPQLVVMVDGAAFECGVFQVQNMPAVAGIF